MNRFKPANSSNRSNSSANGPKRNGPRKGLAARYQKLRQNLNRSSAPAQPIEVPEGLVFYCRSCEHIIDMKPKTFDFKTPVENCQKPEKIVDENDMSEDSAREKRRRTMECDIVFGTERSIKRHFKIPDQKYDQERREREDRAAKADKL